MAAARGSLVALLFWICASACVVLAQADVDTYSSAYVSVYKYPSDDRSKANLSEYLPYPDDRPSEENVTALEVGIKSLLTEAPLPLGSSLGSVWRISI